MLTRFSNEHFKDINARTVKLQPSVFIAYDHLIRATIHARAKTILEQPLRKIYQIINQEADPEPDVNYICMRLANGAGFNMIPRYGCIFTLLASAEKSIPDFNLHVHFEVQRELTMICAAALDDMYTRRTAKGVNRKSASFLLNVGIDEDTAMYTDDMLIVFKQLYIHQNALIAVEGVPLNVITAVHHLETDADVRVRINFNAISARIKAVQVQRFADEVSTGSSTMLGNILGRPNIAHTGFEYNVSVAKRNQTIITELSLAISAHCSGIKKSMEQAIKKKRTRLYTPGISPVDKRKVENELIAIADHEGNLISYVEKIEKLFLIQGEKKVEEVLSEYIKEQEILLSNIQIVHRYINVFKEDLPRTLALAFPSIIEHTILTVLGKNGIHR